jgi:hypothetical protein
LDNERYGYGLDSDERLNTGLNGAGSTALYHHNGSRYGLGMPTRSNGTDTKMNGLHGPKHKRGDVDREFELIGFVSLPHVYCGSQPVRWYSP